MDGLNFHALEPAHSFFQRAIGHMDIELGGVLTPKYRDYLIEKREYYITATKLIEEELKKCLQ